MCIPSLYPQGALHLACQLRHVNMIMMLLSVGYQWRRSQALSITTMTHPVSVAGLRGSARARESKATYAMPPLLCVVAGPSSELLWQPPSVAGSGTVASRPPKALLSGPDPHLGRAGGPSPESHVLLALSALLSYEQERVGDSSAVQQYVDTSAIAHVSASSALSGETPPITWLTLLSRSRQPMAAEVCSYLMKLSKLDATPVLRRLTSEQAEAELLEALRSGEPAVAKAWVASESAATLDWSALASDTLQAFESLATDGDDAAALGELLSGSLSSRCCICALRLSGGVSLLHRAAAADRAAKVKLLLDARADCDKQCTAKGDSALHWAAAASAFATVEVLLADASGRRCVHLKNADGKAPIDCVDKSKRSASATVAKRIHQLLTTVADKEAQSHSTPSVAVEHHAAPPPPPAALPAVAPEAKPQTAVGKEKSTAAPEPVQPAAKVSESEALRRQLAHESTALTRRALEELLAKPLVEDSAPAKLQLGQQAGTEPSASIGSSSAAADGAGTATRSPGNHAGAGASGTDATTCAATGTGDKSTGDAKGGEIDRQGSAESERATVDVSDALTPTAPTPSETTPAEAVPLESSCVQQRAQDDTPTADACPAVTTPAAAATGAAAVVAASPAAAPAAAPATAAAAMVAAVPISEVSMFEDHPWRVLIVRPAARDLSGLEVSDKQAALRSLSTLAAGIWSGHDVKHLSGASIPRVHRLKHPRLFLAPPRVG